MKVVCYTEPTEKGMLLYYPNQSVKSELLHLWKGVKEKYNGYMTLTLDKPYKSRTTGEGSQNNLFYALVTEICKETGNEIEDVKDALKERAVKRGYPYTVNKITGTMKPCSTTQVNTVEMGYLIDEAMFLCSELGIVLSPDMRAEKPAKDEAENYDIF